MYEVLGADFHCLMFSLVFLKFRPSHLLAIPFQQSFSLQQFIFPLQQSPSSNFPPKKKKPSPSKSQVKKASSFIESLLPSGKQGGAVVLGEG
jgi:hypothetical protein